MNYKWKNDRNNFLNDQLGKKFFKVLPQNVQLKIYTDFIFSEFLRKFNRFFSFKAKCLQSKFQKKETVEYDLKQKKIIANSVLKKFRKKVQQIIQAIRVKKLNKLKEQNI